MKRLIIFAAIVAALSMTAVAFASPSPISGSGVACDMSTTPVVNVHFTLTNDLDSAVGGTNWANDTISRQLQIYSLGGDNYCVAVSDQGSFVTLADFDPNTGTTVISAGITGKIKGGYTGPVTGTFAPSAYATSGNLGSFDLAISPDHPSYLSYFSNPPTSDGAFNVWGWSYHTSHNGTWINASSGNSGDITG